MTRAVSDMWCLAMLPACRHDHHCVGPPGLSCAQCAHGVPSRQRPGQHVTRTLAAQRCVDTSDQALPQHMHKTQQAPTCRTNPIALRGHSVALLSVALWVPALCVAITLPLFFHRCRCSSTRSLCAGAQHCGSGEQCSVAPADRITSLRYCHAGAHSTGRAATATWAVAPHSVCKVRERPWLRQLLCIALFPPAESQAVLICLGMSTV